jgi:hypothetical protein
VHPNQTLVELPDGTEGFVGVDKAHVEAFSPGTDLKPVRELANTLFIEMFDKLEISTLSRIGLRLFFEHTFSDKESAAKAVFENTRFPQPKGKHFNIEGKVSDPELAMRWEGEKTGCSVRIQAVHQILDIGVPKDFREPRKIALAADR